MAANTCASSSTVRIVGLLIGAPGGDGVGAARPPPRRRQVWGTYPPWPWRRTSSDDHAGRSEERLHPVLRDRDVDPLVSHPGVGLQRHLLMGTAPDERKGSGR